ncbi:MAG: mechanosensitive ion channel family protein [Sphingomonadales bacterium]|nr:mechanosensitive ion channel family protein [Sphingomonadales bacterium]
MAALVRRLLALLLLILALALAPGARAEGPDYKSWETAAAEVQTIIGEGTVSNERLSELRADMVKWRAEFTAAQGTNGDEIATVRDQIAALGPAPAEGATEDPTIAKRRTELTETLARLQAPGLSATEAASRADGIIRNIDRLVRERQADKLLRLSPSPANPVNWGAGLSLFRWMGAWIYDETHWRFTRPINWETLRNNAPLIAGLLLASAVMLLRGPRWIGRLADWLQVKTQMRGRGLVSGIVSLGQVFVPFAGAVLLVTAAQQTGFFGPILTDLLTMFPAALLVVLIAGWLGGRVFPRAGTVQGIFGLPEEQRTEARVHVITLGFAVALQALLTDWIVPRAQDYLGGSGNVGADKAAAVAERADAAYAVLSAPLIIFAALTLFRLAQLMRRHALARTEADAEIAFRFKLLHWLSNAVIVISVVAPVLALIGYVAAADALTWPTIATLGVLALVVVLQGFVSELYDVVTRRESAAGEALVPVIAGFLLILAALPVLALIWGARPEDLAELWTRFRGGVALGGVQISPAVFMTFVVVFGIGYTATRLLQGALKSTVLPKTSIDKGGQNAIVSGIGYVGIFLAAVIAISAAGIDLSSLAIVAGALSVGIGFGLQNIVQNFVSGIILLIERPISEGDWIEVGGQQGTVKAISVRSTIIETFDRTDVIVPNGDLVAGQVTNWTRGNKTGRIIVPVGVAYGTDTRRVSEILLEIAQAQPLVMMAPAPFVVFTGFGADSLDFEIRAILSDINFGLRVKTEINHQIAERFTAEGIEIPFAQRDIWLRNPEALNAGAKRPGEAAAPAAPSEGAQALPRPMSPPEPGEAMEAAHLSDNDGAEEGDSR